MSCQFLRVFDYGLLYGDTVLGKYNVFLCGQVDHVIFDRLCGVVVLSELDGVVAGEFRRLVIVEI